MTPLLRLGIIVISTIPITTSDQVTISNWEGDFPPCNNRFELIKHSSMDLGVKIYTSNPKLGHEFRKALDFWTTVVDMQWHEDESNSCAMQLVDGTPVLLKTGIVARSQFTEWRNFQGWIAFDPKASLTDTELYLTAVHEIGHMLGLKHNPSPHSVMYYLDLEGEESLDKVDLAALAEKHKLKVGLVDPILVDKI